MTSPAMHTEKPGTVLRGSVILGAAVSLAVCYRIATRSLILGSQAAGWFYGYHQLFSPRFLEVFVIACAAGALLWLPDPRPGRQEWTRVLAWWAVAIGVQWLLRSIAPFTLESLFQSDGANGFYGWAAQVTPADLLRHFNRLRRLAPLHVQANMPGKVMLLLALEALTTSPRVLAWLVAGLSTMGGVLLYVFTKELLADRKAALLAAILYWFYPARIFFLPIMNTVTPVLVLASACLLLRWLRTGHTRYPVALGLSLYVLVFFEPLPLVIGLLFAALAARAMAAGDIRPNRWIAQACLMVIVFLATAEAVDAAFGFDLVPALRQTAVHARAFNDAAGRPYGFWVRENLIEFLFGIGLCQAVLFGGVLIHALRARVPAGARLTRPIVALSLGLMAVLLTTDVIGINRGEVIRLWIFLGAFFQIPAAYGCAALESRAACFVVVACTLLQATLGTAMIGFVVP